MVAMTAERIPQPLAPASHNMNSFTSGVSTTEFRLVKSVLLMPLVQGLQSARMIPIRPGKKRSENATTSGTRQPEHTPWVFTIAGIVAVPLQGFTISLKPYQSSIYSSLHKGLDRNETIPKTTTRNNETIRTSYSQEATHHRQLTIAS